MEKWDERFLTLARHVASWSKDPSTKVGAIIVRPDRTIASVGYNGFPRGISDDAERYAHRETKYAFIIHGEMNAILNAREPLAGYTLYTHPFCPCDRCAMHVIQSGIIRVVAPRPGVDLVARWGDSLTRTAIAFNEAKVELVEY